MEVYSTIVSFFQEGGLFMYPIVLIFALGLAIAVERYLFLTVITTKNKVNSPDRLELKNVGTGMAKATALFWGRFAEPTLVEPLEVIRRGST